MNFPTITEFLNLGTKVNDSGYSWKREIEFKIVFTLSDRTVQPQVKYGEEHLAAKWFRGIVESKFESVYKRCKNGKFDEDRYSYEEFKEIRNNFKTKVTEMFSFFDQNNEICKSGRSISIKTTNFEEFLNIFNELTL